MVYVINKGVKTRAKERMLKAITALLPVSAIFLIALALFSYSSREASGQKPDFSPSSTLGSSVTNPVSGEPGVSDSASSSEAGPATGSSSVYTQPEYSSPATVSGVSAQLPTAPRYPSDASSNPNPAQTSLTIPPLDIQAADKQILSTGGTVITLN